MFNKRKIQYKAMISFIFLLLFSSLLFAQEKITVETIMEKYQKAFYYAGNDMKAKVLMTLINKEGKMRIRELVMLRKNMQKNGEQKYFMYFINPADVRRTTFVVWKYPKRDDDRWLFIPAINLVSRIAANDKHSSFVGSDFTYENVSGRDLESDTHNLIGEETINERNCYKVEITPIDESGFSKRILWIDKSTYLPVKEDYYDIQGELYKIFTAEKIEEIEGIWTIIKRTMENVKTGHKTITEFGAVNYNVGLPDNLFTERFMRNPPRSWIK